MKTFMRFCDILDRNRVKCFLSENDPNRSYRHDLRPVNFSPGLALFRITDGSEKSLLLWYEYIL
jgi:hypothetical protein